MNETILNGKLLTWTDRIFKQINIIEGTKKHNGNKTRFYTGKYFKETGSFYGTDIWRTGFTGNVWSSRSDNRGLVWNYRRNLRCIDRK